MANILKGHKVANKSKIENMLVEAYNHNSFEYLGLCDGQVVYDSEDEESWKEVYFDKAKLAEECDFMNFIDNRVGGEGYFYLWDDEAWWVCFNEKKEWQKYGE